MDNFGSVKVSWTKHLTLEVAMGIKKELEFWKSEEILMITTDGHIASHNISTEKIKYLSIESMYLYKGNDN